MELPPRARRIRQAGQTKPFKSGTTSACAENTFHPLYSGVFFRNYLRVRGEYDCFKTSITASWELPPRARRILFTVDVVAVTIGTTSACAENTGDPHKIKNGRWNYLRVRGEY